MNLVPPEHPLSLVSREEIDRRTFLKLVSAAALAAGATGCAAPTGEIVPYVSHPPEVVPGVPIHFATAMELDGYATGLIVASREGRPVKVEGNPAHPASLGAAGAFHQAAIYQLYDPDRPQFVRRRGAPAGWVDVEAAFSDAELRRIAGQRGGGLAFLIEPTASALVASLLDRVRERFPDIAVCSYAPLSTSFGQDGTRMVLGREYEPILDLRNGDVILTLDADLLGEGPFSLRYARQFADARRIRRAGDRMNRLYCVEGAFTPTGMAADHRLMVRPGDIRGVAAALLRQVMSTTGTDRPAPVRGLDALATSAHAGWIEAASRDLSAHRGRAVVVAGMRQPPIVHALVAALNDVLGAIGATLSYVEPVLPGSGTPFTQFVSGMHDGDIRALVIVGGNPSYNAPAQAGFAAALQRVPLTLYAGPYQNETAHDAGWFVPLAHFLESWGDSRALDGTTSIVQPLISPLHGGRSIVDLLSFFGGDDRPSYDVVREYWLGPARMAGDDDRWRACLQQGVIAGTAVDGRSPALVWTALESAVTRETPVQPPPVEIALVPDRSVHDGRFGNNAWLQELPDPVTKLTWDNAAYVSQHTLEAIGLRESEFVDISVDGRHVRAPAFAAPGVADGLIVLPLGYGRTAGGRVASGVGFDAYPLWAGDRFSVPATAAPWTRAGLRESHEFAMTAVHWSLEGRPIVIGADLDRFESNPNVAADESGSVPTLYPPMHGQGPQWGMSIDLTVCTGCSACVVACQVENNVPVVGKSGVQQRREMHWLRIDRYLGGTGSDPQIELQPMLCQHCEEAPCEYVCPVNATVHSPDGLNEMVYNRCVGTRFCSNNCPYKVRRFNFLNYTQELPETEQMGMNPDVTVRARGVMEKCTFCVQRIRRADIDAQLAGSNAPYSGLQTACQQACPTRAIVFGSIADPEAEVSRERLAPHTYRALNELGTRPRVTYLARIRNPNRSVPEETT